MDQKDIENLIKNCWEEVSKHTWETLEGKSWYDIEPTLSEKEWEDLFLCLKNGIPHIVSYSAPYFSNGENTYYKQGTFSKASLLKYLEYLTTLFGSDSHPKPNQFKKDFPSIYHSLCVDYVKIPLILKEDMYDPIVLEWRLKKGV